MIAGDRFRIPNGLPKFRERLIRRFPAWRAPILRYVEAGTARLIGTDRARIVAESLRLLDDGTHYATMSRAHNPYGDGKANDRIAAILTSSRAARATT